MLWTQPTLFVGYAVDPRVVAVIGPCDRGLDAGSVEDSYGAARQKHFVMGTDCIGPHDSVVASAIGQDLHDPASPN